MATTRQMATAAKAASAASAASPASRIGIPDLGNAAREDGNQSGIQAACEQLKEELAVAFDAGLELLRQEMSTFRQNVQQTLQDMSVPIP